MMVKAGSVGAFRQPRATYRGCRPLHESGSDTSTHSRHGGFRFRARVRHRKHESDALDAAGGAELSVIVSFLTGVMNAERGF